MEYAEHIFTRHYNDLVHLQRKSDAYSAARIALILRLWLIDSSSLIHSINKSRAKVKLTFEWIEGVSPLHLFDRRLNHVVLHSMYMDGVKAEFARDMRTGPIQKLLSSGLLHWGGRTFSVKEVVKYVANNLGGAHFSNSLIHGLNTERPDLQSVPLDLLGICIKVVADVVVNSTLRELRDAVVKYPEGTPVVSHWKAPHGKVMYFNGVNQYMHSTLEDRTLSPDLFGFLWAGKILRPKTVSQRVVAHLGSNQRQGFDFKLQCNRTALVATIRYAPRGRISLEFPEFFTNYFNRWCTIGVFLIRDKTGVTMLLSLNGPIVNQATTQNVATELYYNRISIGANVVGKQCAEVQFQEAVLASGNFQPIYIDNLIDYITGSWQR